jgi:hypothetical protein
MSNTTKINEEFIKSSKDAAGIYFLESEYWKRKFLLENEGSIDSIKSDICLLNEYFDELASSVDKKNPIMYPLTPIKIMQREFYRKANDAQVVYGDNEKLISSLLLSLQEREFPNNIKKILKKINHLSFRYHYYVDDLIAPADMDELAPLILGDNSSLPSAPCPYHHKDAVSEISENVYRSGFSVHSDEKINLFTVQGEFKCDFMALINFRHRKFNYSDVVNTFRKQLAYLIYCQKGFDNLTHEEKKDLIYTFKSDAGKGYGSEFIVSRAVGLWIWDYKFKNKGVKKIAIFREIENTKYNKHYDVKNIKSTSSDYTKLSRILDKTNRCVESGKVLVL